MDTPRIATAPRRLPTASCRGAGRIAGRSGNGLPAPLDELDYGIVLLFDGTSIVHINDAAQVELDELHPLQRVGNELRARLARDVAPLHEAVTAAASRGMRRLLTVGEETHRTSVSVVRSRPPTRPARRARRPRQARGVRIALGAGIRADLSASPAPRSGS